MSCAKTAQLTEMPFGGLTHMGPRNHVLDGVQIPPREGELLRGDVLAHCNVPMHECIVHCLPGAKGEYIFAPHVRQTNAFTAVWSDKTAVRSIPNYFRHLLQDDYHCHFH